MKKRIIITGGHSFIGRNLSSYLYNEGYDLFSVVGNNSCSDSRMEIHFLKGDFLDKEDLHELFPFVNLETRLIILRTCSHKKIIIHIEPEQFRPAENIMRISNNHKLSQLGYQPVFSIRDIASDQVYQYVRQDGYL